MSDAATLANPIIRPERNCWCVERARHVYTIQDGDYFRLVREALLRARHTVFILGWDITGTIDLLPGAPEPAEPRHLDKLIAYIAKRRPQLRVYILIWDYGALFTLERDPFSRWRFGWRMPRGVRFGFDDHHPAGACHHQKIVVIDDQLAFSGGMDLTGHRWDTPAHQPDNPARTTPLGDPYEPYHEVQAMADGPIAARLGALVRDRWRAVSAERMPPIGAAADDLWPADITPDFTDVDVAIARTVPGSATEPPIRECEALFLDAIAQAKQTLYIENQYFTNTTLADAMVARLAEPDGPEIVLVLPRGGDGWLERNTVEVFRNGVFRRLIAADAHRRLRLVFPMASRARDLATFIHSKVLIVDDTHVRIGSANLNHRSMGVDTECDLAIDAAGNDTLRAAIRGIRDRLIAEHLGLAVEAVAPAIERAGSLRALVDAHEHNERALVRFDPPPEETSEPSEAVRAAVDPDEPMGLGPSVARLLPPIDPAMGRAPLRIWIVPVAVVMGAVFIAGISSPSFRRGELQSVRHAIEIIRSTPAAEAIGVAVFVVAGFVLIPLELLVLAAGVAFGLLRGGLVALIGSLVAAAIGYVAGRLIGPDAISSWVRRRAYRSGRQLGAHGIAGVAVLRLAAVASAGAIHLLCGAARVPFGRYLAGTVAGLAPSIVALSGLGALVARTIRQPTAIDAGLTVAAGLGLVALALGVRTFLLIRQFAPSVSTHRGRAEFG